jgi:hypothetical protein
MKNSADDWQERWYLPNLFVPYKIHPKKDFGYSIVWFLTVSYFMESFITYIGLQLLAVVGRDAVPIFVIWSAIILDDGLVRSPNISRYRFDGAQGMSSEDFQKYKINE